MSSKKLQPTVTISENPSEIFVVRWSPDGKLVAAGAGDGAIQVFLLFSTTFFGGQRGVVNRAQSFYIALAVVGGGGGAGGGWW